MTNSFTWAEPRSLYRKAEERIVLTVFSHSCLNIRPIDEYQFYPLVKYVRWFAFARRVLRPGVATLGNRASAMSLSLATVQRNIETWWRSCLSVTEYWTIIFFPVSVHEARFGKPAEKF
jgi:hypothetical protein